MKITSEHSVTLLGIKIDNQLNLTIMYQHYAKKQVPSVMLLVDLENTLVFLGKKGFDRSLCIFKF